MITGAPDLLAVNIKMSDLQNKKAVQTMKTSRYKVKIDEEVSIQSREHGQSDHIAPV